MLLGGVCIFLEGGGGSTILTTESASLIETLNTKLWPPWSRRSQLAMWRSALEKCGMGPGSAMVVGAGFAGPLTWWGNPCCQELGHRISLARGRGREGEGRGFPSLKQRREKRELFCPFTVNMNRGNSVNVNHCNSHSMKTHGMLFCAILSGICILQIHRTSPNQTPEIKTVRPIINERSPR